MRKSTFTESQIIKAIKANENGQRVEDLCTDFVINLANLLDLSYYDLNALIFCVIWPLVTVLLIVMNLVSWVKLKKVK